MELLPVVIVIVLGFAILFFFINKRLTGLSQQKTDQALLEWLKSMQTSIDNNNKNITTSLHMNSKALNDRLDNAAKIIASVQKNIGEMSEIGRSMQQLQEFLRSPKLRGNIGEQVLKELLGQMLPKQSFHLQYAFKSGAIVDAAIKTEAGIIPIDSKFPMENFRKMMDAQNETEKKMYEKELIQDVKRHIDAISNKYILTSEGTIDYALMYVPSEAVYYEIINSTHLFDYAHEKRVVPVSPMTFYAYLKAILMGFEGQKIGKFAHEILSNMRSVQKEYEKVEEHIETLTKHINNSYNMMNQVNTSLSKLGQKITSTNSLGEKEEMHELPV